MAGQCPVQRHGKKYRRMYVQRLGQPVPPLQTQWTCGRCLVRHRYYCKQSTVDTVRCASQLTNWSMGFSASHQPRSCVTPNFPKWGSNTRIWRFSRGSWQKTLKVCNKVSLTKKLPGQIVAPSTTYRTYQRLAGDDDDPVHV